MIHFLVSKKEYENIKSNKETIIVVEAKGECPIYVDISPLKTKLMYDKMESYHKTMIRFLGFWM